MTGNEESSCCACDDPYSSDHPTVSSDSEDHTDCKEETSVDHEDWTERGCWLSANTVCLGPPLSDCITVEHNCDTRYSKQLWAR